MGPDAWGRLNRAFRVGLPGASPEWIRPIASIGLARDAGIFVAPVEASDGGWAYGVVSDRRLPIEGRFAEVGVRPKLHWHRSGVVSATLTGHELPRIQARLAPLGRLGPQMITGMACYPRLIGQDVPIRKRDILVLPHQSGGRGVVAGPSRFMFSLNLRRPGDRDWHDEELGPIGLVEDVHHETVVNLSSYGLDLVVACQVQYSTEFWPTDRPGITIAAYNKRTGHPRPRSVFALWSLGQRNPAIHVPE